MSTRKDLPREISLAMRDACLCLHLQRAARVVARRFDEAFRPLGLTNHQFSLLISLNRPEPAQMSEVAGLLAIDRTTLTANLKPLERRGLVKIALDPEDKRSRRLALTPAGRALLVEAVPVWKRTHAALDRLLGEDNPDRLRRNLRALS
jgi:DNA-binding MarR family transcriptional regulator